MSQLLTFKEAKNSRLVEVANLCNDSDGFRQLLNEATQRLMLRGDFVGLQVPIAFCVRDGCITWPRLVGTVRGLKVGCQPVQVDNHWGYGFLNGPGSWWGQWNGCGGRAATSINIGHAATYADLKGSNKKVRFYIDCLEDVGKQVILRGFIDSNGQPLKEKNASGNWVYQKTLTLADQYVSTAEDIQKFGRVVLPDDLECRVRVYSYDTVEDNLIDLAVYEPGETNPWYARSQVRGGCGIGYNARGNNSCNGLTNVVALVKLQFVPVARDEDLVLISNIGALKNAFMAIRLEEDGEDEKAVTKWILAVKELNLQLGDEQPPWTVPSASRPFSGQRYSNQMV